MVQHYNAPMWHFGHCVTFLPCECHFLDLPIWLFGPEAVPCQWHPLPQIKKTYRNSLEIKMDNKIQFQFRRNTQTQEPQCFPLIQYIYCGQLFSQHLNKELCAFNARNRLLRLADKQQHVIPLSSARTWEESQDNLKLRHLQAVSRQIGAVFIVHHYVINQYA